MEIRVLSIESQTDRIEIPLFGAATDEVTIFRVTTKQEFKDAIDGSDLDLVISGDNLAWPVLEACQYLRQVGSEVPFVLLSQEDDPDVRRDALCAGAWHTAPRSQPEVMRAVLSMACAQATARRERIDLQKAVAGAEEGLQRNQKSMAMGLMLGSIAHEINNPLEGMANLLYLARRSPHDLEKLEIALDMAEAELNRVSAITKQMLSFHREAEKPKEVSLAEILNGVLAMLTPRLREKQTKVVRQYRSPGWILAQPGELRQLFLNLLANALDAMESGGTLTLRVREFAGPVPRICVSVGDTGKGFSRAIQKNIGKLFFTTKGEGGTGLGMWVVHRIVKKYDAGLCVHSSEASGKSGTVFRLCFQQPPAFLAKSHPPAKSHPMEAQHSPASSNQEEHPPGDRTQTNRRA